MRLVARPIVWLLSCALRSLALMRVRPPRLTELVYGFATAKAGGDVGAMRIATYERLFAPLRTKPITLVEIGVLQGESLRLWRSYFPRARLIGVDVSEHVAQLPLAGIEIRVGDQNDRRFLDELVASAPQIDVVIDDGGHRAEQQLTTLLHLWRHLSPGGVYAIEDTQTSYLPEYGMRWHGAGTTIEVLKGVADDVHARWHEHPVILEGVESVSFQPALCVIRKASAPRPPSIRERAHGAVARAAFRRSLRQPR